MSTNNSTSPRSSKGGRPRWLPIVAVLAFGAVLGGGYLVSKPRGLLVTEALDRAGLLCSLESEQLTADIAFLTRTTRFAGKWSINEAARSDRLNFYFYCGQSEKQPSVIAAPKNCAYIGQPNLIVCDAMFFQNFVLSSGLVGELSSFPSKDAQIKKAERNLLLWVLGHEIGHIMNGDRPAHFSASDLRDIGSPRTLDQKRELDADHWFVQQLRMDTQRALDVEVLLLELVYAQTRAKVGTEHLHPATGVPITSQMVEYAQAGSHPEFIIRATRMLSVSLDRPGAEFMKRQIDSFARTLREKEAPSK